MPSRKLKLVVSDFHLGKGPYREDGSVNVFEDFRHDGKFAEFLDYHCEGEFEGAETELIVNGDFFNLLSIDLDGRLQEAITERVAVEKTDAILGATRSSSTRSRAFAGDARRSVTFIMGNHDPGLLFAGVRDVVARRVGGTHRFLLDGYDFDGVHVEHGMQREPMNAFNPERYFRERKGELFLNLPLGSRYIISVLNEEKAQRPYIDKVAPFELLPLGDPERSRGGAAHLVPLGPLRRRGGAEEDPHLDPMPLADLAKALLRYTAFPTLEHEARHLLARKGYHTVIMGHTHVPIYREYGARQGLPEHRHLERDDLARRRQPRPDRAAHVRARRLRRRPSPAPASASGGGSPGRRRTCSSEGPPRVAPAFRRAGRVPRAAALPR